MRRILGILGALTFLGCSSAAEVAAPGDAENDAPPADGANGDAVGETTADSGGDGASGGDGDTSSSSDATDATDAGDPLATLVSCLGTVAVLAVSGQMPYSDVPVGTTSGKFLVDYATTFSSIDLAAFAAPGPKTSGCDPTKLGQYCTVDGFAFFSPPGPVVLVTEDFSFLKGSVRQAGIVGTDFTSLKIVTLSYGSSRIFGSSKSGFCADSALTAAKFGALPTDGFFSNSFGSLKPMSAVVSSATTGHVPDVPTVPMRIGGASAVAQLDTGFNDALVPFSVNVNSAYYSAIAASDAGALVRDASHDLTLSTCLSGVSEKVQAYKLGSGRKLDFVDAGGIAVRSYSGATIFVKTTSPKACGGIGTWTVPAAQVAASFFVEMGTLVFDPYSSRVWIPR